MVKLRPLGLWNKTDCFSFLKTQLRQVILTKCPAASFDMQSFEIGRHLLPLVCIQVTNLKSMRYFFFTSLVMEDAIWSRGDARKLARAHKIVINFMISSKNLGLVQDILKTYIVNCM